MKKLFFTLAATVLLSASHPWDGKRIAYLGDSITDRNLLPSETHYWAYLQEWLDTETYVYGVSGHQWTDVLGQAERLKNERGENIDAIMIFLGTNDFNCSAALGEWYDYTYEVVNADGKMVERRRRNLIFDESTFRGRINIALDSLKRMYPTKQIVLLTPIHRGPAKFSETNVQPSEEYCNACGEYIDAYVNVIKEASAIWSVPVIDMYSLCGLLPSRPEHSIYVPGENDFLHPNKEGHRRMALCIYHQLKCHPGSF